jgi:glycosyltransferase involved in cell wall biosynthesis
MKKIKKTKLMLAIYALHPIQYQAPIFRKVASSGEFDLTVLYGDDVGIRNFHQIEFSQSIVWDIPLLDGYKYKIMRNFKLLNRLPFFSRVNFGLIKEILFGKYDIILIHGYETFSAWFVLILAKLIKTKIIFRGESIPKFDQETNIKIKIKEFLVKLFLKSSDAIMYSCAGNRKRWEQLGVKREKLFFMPCAVDNAYFQEKRTKTLPRRNELRKGLGIPIDSFVVLFPARFTGRKRPYDLIKAVEKLKDKNIYILFVGDGPERRGIEEAVRVSQISAKFVGFVNQSKLPEYYTISDVAAVISEYDASPKSINEAMNFGLPIIVSDRVGTSADLVENKGNGFVIKVGNVDEIAHSLEMLYKNQLLYSQMSTRSEEIVKNWNFDENVKALKKASDSIIK